MLDTYIVVRYILTVRPADLQTNPTLRDYQALAAFRYQIRRFLHFSEQAARSAGVEPQQHQALLAIKGLTAASATIGDLAEQLQIQHHSAVELVNRLVEHGLVARQRDSADRRRVLVRLTAGGEATLHELSRHHLAELRSTGPALIAALDRLIAKAAPAAEPEPPAQP